MIKRIIFDVDDTLIDFPSNFAKKYQEVIDKHNLNIDYKLLFKVIDEYEFCGDYKYYNKEDLLAFINKRLNLQLDDKFINSFFDMYNYLITPVSKEVKDTLKYLKDKYELVILSNWFTDSQVNRLKCAGILDYFDHIYCSDLVPMKPNKESYIAACGNHKLNECLIVGDSLKNDIEIPYLLEMNVYHLTDKATNYPSIKKISDLKELL